MNPTLEEMMKEQNQALKELLKVACETREILSHASDMLEKLSAPNPYDVK